MEEKSSAGAFLFSSHRENSSVRFLPAFMIQLFSAKEINLKKSQKITRLPSFLRLPVINVGMLVFGSILVYMIIGIFFVMTEKYVPTYEVTAGAISGNYRYTALALKNETVFRAGYTGYVTYYARSGSRAGSGMTICTIDEYGSGTPDYGSVDLSQEDMKQLHQSISGFSLNFSGNTFQNVYNFKSDIQSLLVQARQDSDVQVSGLVNLVNTPSSGFVVYSMDGMEGMTEEQITKDVFNTNNYRVTNLRTDGKIRSGDILYKLITGEDWFLYFPLSSDLATRLQERTSVRFRFLKDNTTFSAGFTMMELNGTTYGRISLKNSLVRYVNDRYLEIELLMSSKSGLKVPASAITEKVFYCIPKDYVITNPDDSNEVTLLRERPGKNGQSSVTYLTTHVYSRTSDGYLVETNLFADGDYVQMAGTTKRHKVTSEDLVTLQGVYNVNKGYAQFRQVTVIDQNEEFCIVEPFSTYGLAAHDYIVLDADTVTSDQIIR